MRPAADRFTIRWDESWGGYRVSCPEVSTDGEPVEVVYAPVHDQAVNYLQAIRACCGYTVPGGEFDVERDELEGVMRAVCDFLDGALASRDSQDTKETP